MVADALMSWEKEVLKRNGICPSSVTATLSHRTDKRLKGFHYHENNDCQGRMMTLIYDSLTLVVIDKFPTER